MSRDRPPCALDSTEYQWIIKSDGQLPQQGTFLAGRVRLLLILLGDEPKKKDKILALIVIIHEHVTEIKNKMWSAARAPPPSFVMSSASTTCAHVHVQLVEGFDTCMRCGEQLAVQRVSQTEYLPNEKKVYAPAKKETPEGVSPKVYTEMSTHIVQVCSAYQITHPHEALALEVMRSFLSSKTVSTRSYKIEVMATACLMYAMLENYSSSMNSLTVTKADGTWTTIYTSAPDPVSNKGKVG